MTATIGQFVCAIQHSKMDMETTTESAVYEDHTEFLYLGFGFERRIYLYVWEIIVILTCLVNCLVITVLMRDKNRNATNMILMAIAVSDSMTGLVTLPSYIMVYQTFGPTNDGFGDDMYNLTMTTPGTADLYKDTEINMSHYDYENVTQTFESRDGEQLIQELYALDKDLCRAFLISKFFISKMFHTISIWLTLLLCLQRYISVAFPFKAQTWFSINNTIIICVSIAASSPLLHIYHLINEKAKHGWCQWDVSEPGGQAYLWITLFLMHFLPCVSLTVFTVLFIIKLWKGSSKIERMSNCTNRSSQKRTDDNRRNSVVVTAIAIVFLIPEIPYGVFLLYSAILTQTNKELLSLNINRGIHAAYEISIVLSFHANFYIFIIFNLRFRKTLMQTFVVPIQRLFGKKPSQENHCV